MHEAIPTVPGEEQASLPPRTGVSCTQRRPGPLWAEGTRSQERIGVNEAIGSLLFLPRDYRDQFAG